MRLCLRTYASCASLRLLFPQKYCVFLRIPFALAGGFFVVGLRKVFVLFPCRRVVLFGYTVLLRRSFVLLRSAAFRTVLHPRFAFVQLAFADQKILEGIALRLCRRFVFKHIRADHFDERASFAVAQIGKRLTIEGQKRKVLVPLIQPAAFARGVAIGFQIA